MFSSKSYFTGAELKFWKPIISGCRGYFSPEYAMQGQLSEKVYVYSYGIVVLEVISGRKCIDSSLPLEERFLKDWVSSNHDKYVICH